jgi:hypothetical protein
MDMLRCFTLALALAFASGVSIAEAKQTTTVHKTAKRTKPKTKKMKTAKPHHQKAHK